MRRFAAFFLSLFAVGTGQFFLGRWKRAIAWVAFAVIVPAIGALALDMGWFVIGFILLLAGLCARPFSAIDAAVIAPSEGWRPSGVFVGAMFIGSLTVLVLSAMGVRVALVEAFKVPSGGMMPTILPGDHLFVDKRKTPPKRGRAVLHLFPENRELEFIHRVVGLGGDHVEMKDGHPRINGVEVPHCLVGHATLPKRADPGTDSGDVFVEFLDGTSYLTLVDPTSALPNEGPWTVPENEVFVLGDNRNNSHDSRKWRGGLGDGVPQRDVLGEPFVAWLGSTDDGAADYARAGTDLRTPILPASLSALKPALDKCLAARPH